MITRAIRCIALALTACAAAIPAIPAEETPAVQNVTVQGEILDMACWMAHGAKGEEHAKCAQACAKGGQPVGLLAADGTVYLLYASHQDGAPFAQAKELAGKKAEVVGVPADRGGMRGLEVHAVKGS